MFSPGERVPLEDLRRSVAAARVGDPLVAAQEVGAIDEAVDRVERGRRGVIPEIVNKFVVHDGSWAYVE